ncbi:hypothetical protein [Dyadobacter sp. BHUBP1]|uniref:hypothetical protein n=1 Tax=Dyadobacter sp. BHUBP1 TaxID=3424178 RepID=UPI003D32FDAA
MISPAKPGNLVFMLLGFLCFIVASCAAPKLTNNDRGRYKYVVLKNSKSILDVTVTPTPLPDPVQKQQEKPKTFFDLRDSIPITFLRSIASVSNEPTDILKAINTPLSKSSEKKQTDEDGKIKLEQSTTKLRLHISSIQSFFNDPALLHPNTKLEFLNTKVWLMTNDVIIQTIDRLENEFEAIDMGTLERTNDIKFSSALSGGIGKDVGREISSTESDDSSFGGSDEQSESTGDGATNTATSKSGTTKNSVTKKGKSIKSNVAAKSEAKAELQYANSESIKEAIALKYKRAKTSFSFSPNRLTVSQRAVPMVGISDNIFVTLTLAVKNTGSNTHTFEVIEFKKMFDSKGKIQPMDSVTRRTVAVKYIPCDSAKDIKLAVSYSGAVRATRNLTRGRNSLEYDDKVTYYKFQDSTLNAGITIDKFDYCKRSFHIVTTIDKEKYILNTGSQVAPMEVLLHSDHEPGTVLRWLSEMITKGDQRLLESSNGDLFFRSTNGKDAIYLSKKHMSSADMEKLRKLQNLSGVERHR